MQVISYNRRNTDYKLQITNYKLQITNYKLQITKTEYEVERKGFKFEEFISRIQHSKLRQYCSRGNFVLVPREGKLSREGPKSLKMGFKL